MDPGGARAVPLGFLPCMRRAQYHAARQIFVNVTAASHRPPLTRVPQQEHAGPAPLTLTFIGLDRVRRIEFANVLCFRILLLLYGLFSIFAGFWNCFLRLPFLFSTASSHGFLFLSSYKRLIRIPMISVLESLKSTPGAANAAKMI